MPVSNGRMISFTMAKDGRYSYRNVCIHGKIDYIIMGIGINTGMKKSEFPEAFRETSTSFLNEGIDVSRKDLLAAILAELEKEYHMAQTEGFDKVLEDWKTLSVTLGQEVRVISEMTATQARLSISIRMDAFW